MKRSFKARSTTSFARRYRVNHGSRFRLRDFRPNETHAVTGREQARELLEQSKEAIASLQDKLYVHGRRALLLIFQAMDAGGKDSAIKHVMSGVNPQGCHVVAFKAPSAEDLGHDFMWRCLRQLPERGRIGIFNRSYYEEVTTVRVHAELLQAQRLPAELVGKRLWQDRLHDIAAIERYLTRNGIVVRKFFLYLSRAEQRERFLARLDDPAKNWKFTASDLRDRQHFPAYMRSYEQAIRATATEHAPWYVIPADHKWYAHLIVSHAIIDALAELDLHYPKPDAATRRMLAAARGKLVREP